MKKLLAIIALALVGHAQTPVHNVTLTWTAAADVTSTTTYNIYRATGACGASGQTFALVNTAPITTLSFVDNSVTVGKFCYTATAVLNGLESIPSGAVGPTVLPLSPASLTVTVK